MVNEEGKTDQQKWEEVKRITAALAAPFDSSAIHFKPGKISGNRAMALVYVDARAIQDRLDEVLGVLGWQDEYECLADGAVVCRLRLRLGDEWITKMDVGAPSEQADEGDRRKAAFSDALKRAAVKFGIGRYLYRIGTQWVEYDSQKRRFVNKPVLPSHSLERKGLTTRPQSRTNSAHIPSGMAGPTNREVESQGVNRHNLPATGLELQQRLNAYDSQLAKQGVCKPGELVNHVVQAGCRAGFNKDLTQWSGSAIHFAVEETRSFAGHKNPSSTEGTVQTANKS